MSKVKGQRTPAEHFIKTIFNINLIINLLTPAY